LIRDGAVLVEKIDDILSMIGTSIPAPQIFSRPVTAPSQPIEKPSDIDTSSIVDLIERALGPSPTSVDEVVRQCQVSPALVATALLELELAGRLERHPGNRVALIGTT
jgi:DNA processing protein